MDKVTSKVRAFYETYPYPPGGAVDCDGYHARLLLSYIERTENGRENLQVLEAGCGRAVNLQAAARLQPDVEFTGIDINRVAIREAQQAVLSRGLSNLKFAEADLLDPSSIPPVEGGYDLILSYGVIHHLSDPLKGLSHLQANLSAQGVIALMVDGSFGRQPLDRYRDILSTLERDGEIASSRMATARALARVAEHTLFKGNCWQGTAEVDEVEFADRCLHVHECNYDMDSLKQLLDAAGLRFVRWLEPADWSVNRLLEEPSLKQLLSQQDEFQRYRLIERLFYRPKLTFVAARQAADSRHELSMADIAQTSFRLNPQVKLMSKESGGASYQLRQQALFEPETLCEQQVMALAELSSSQLSGSQIANRLAESDCSHDAVFSVLYELEARELIYRPNTAFSEVTQ
ncbi:MAG: class I SAM-dependent methyltransferase [Candidatus Thiodiazotropha sp. (ex Gloverina cf. vestifex)]|nr:class I SAM-dependent methyltransferase [Candidatus Thiodiazotropha sp. (ex Gloverina cf. vestifex)]